MVCRNNYMLNYSFYLLSGSGSELLRAEFAQLSMIPFNEKDADIIIIHPANHGQES